MQMKYFFLEPNPSQGEPFAEKIQIPASYFHFYLGNKLPKLKKPIRVTVSKEKPPPTDLLPGPYTFVIASDRLCETFRELESPNVDTAPVDVVCKSRVIAKYHFIQVLNNIDAIDWAQSDLRSYPEDKYGIVEVRKLVLNPDAIGKRNVFRLEGLVSDLVVSDEFRERVQDAGMTGMRFLPTEEFRLS